ncbi:hypothetical protein RI129_010846 [Pyrocoelia pectoralis]|uniref:UDP-glucuronosyltransferase n=1 Tax=Pyrocoelia pectoralis TaxID=417401 RepID=A0AAN7UZN6_9COLE
MHCNCVFFLIFAILHFAICSKILGIAPTPSYSHHQLFKSLWRELVYRGHQVTTITPFPIKDPELINLTEIDLSSSKRIWDENLPGIVTSRKYISSHYRLATTLFNVLEQQLKLTEVQGLINDTNASFDLVIAEFHMSAMFAFAERFNCPLIIVWTMDLTNFQHRMVGNPYNPVAYPDVYLPFLSKRLTLKERVVGSVVSLMAYFHSQLINHWEQGLVRKYFGYHYSHVQDLANNASLVFVNYNPVLNTIRPLMPSVIPIGDGSHHMPLKSLPKDLERMLSNNSGGFIYFSLGTNVRSIDLPKHTLDTIMETFSELPYTILWKYEAYNLPNKPKNVVIRKWWPQRDLLNYPNIKLFITQGGLQSMEEAIYAHIPMVGIPVFCDQPGNVRQMIAKGIGLAVNLDNLNKASFKNTILEVINNPMYKMKVRELAKLAKDQPMTGMERAIWWTEYVLRHKGTPHLKISSALDMPWYHQYLSLDVIVLLLICSTLSIYVLYVVIALIITNFMDYFDRQKKVKTI